MNFEESMSVGESDPETARLADGIYQRGSSNASSGAPTKSPRAWMRIEPALRIIPIEL